MKSVEKKKLRKLEVKGKKILILGFARTGVAAARLGFELGADVLVSDIKSQEELKGYIKMIDGIDAKFFLGSHPESLLKGVDLIITSPGIPSGIPILLKARDMGIEIISEIEFAYNFLKSPIIAITGTNGKTTTTKLIHEILTGAGYKTQALGNIGTPLSEVALKPYKKFVPQKGTNIYEDNPPTPPLNKGEQGGFSDEYDYLVVEVSSFQLEGVVNFKPFISLILNITPDHMDRYSSIGDYARAKFRIFEKQGNGDFLILNYDDPMLKKLLPRTDAQILYFSTKESLKNGSFIKGDEIVTSFDEKTESICSLSDVKLEGLHNLENVLAAITACRICQVIPFKIKETLKEFKPPPHRMEFIREINGIRFINDSKGTNVGAVVKSLMSYSSPIILIAGGRDKNGDFYSLREIVKSKVKSLILLGEAKEKIKKSLEGLTRAIDAKDMEDAVKKSFEVASPGDVVLLSPGCASFDMFNSYEERGVAFKKAVMGLK